ncbi:MAG TPA: tetratricopeptide repeat protein [Polyangia bacterium]|nr:tetratricopeptide repeat protein [Polyangia bacterium]
MRNLKMMLKAFVGVAAVAGMIGCEEVDSPTAKVQSKPVVSSTIPMTQPIATPVAKVEPKIEPKIEQPPKVVDEVADEDGMKPSELIEGARQALSSGETDRALKMSTLATKKAPKRSAAWNTLGRVQLARGQRKDAIASFEKAVELNPSSSWAQNNLGLALIYDGKYEDAIDALEEATQLEPVEGYMWNNLGMAYEHQDRLEEARDAYSKASELKNERARENFARLQGVKTIRTAKADVEPTIAVEPTLPDGGVK